MSRLNPPVILYPAEQSEENFVFVSSWNLKSRTTNVNKALLIRFTGDNQNMKRNVERYTKQTGISLQSDNPCKFQGYNRTPCGDLES